MVLLFEGRLLETILKAERDAAPAGEARNLALGRPRDPTGGHYDPSARSFAGLGLAATPRPRKRGPGDRNRRSGAPRGASSRSQGTRRRLASVSGGRAGRSRGLASPCISRRSAPPCPPKPVGRRRIGRGLTATPAPHQQPGRRSVGCLTGESGKAAGRVTAPRIPSPVLILRSGRRPRLEG